MSQPTYNHAFAVAFTVPRTTSKTGEDLSPAALRQAALKRVRDLGDSGDEWAEAVGAPWDTYEEEPDAKAESEPHVHLLALDARQHRDLKRLLDIARQEFVEFDCEGNVGRFDDLEAAICGDGDTLFAVSERRAR